MEIDKDTFDALIDKIRSGDVPKDFLSHATKQLEESAVIADATCKCSVEAVCEQLAGIRSDYELFCRSAGVFQMMSLTLGELARKSLRQAGISEDVIQEWVGTYEGMMENHS